MLNTSVKTNNPVLKDTIDMLFGLDDAKLMEVQSLIKGFAKEDEDLFKDLCKPLNEAELVARIDKAIAEADAGDVIDSEIMEKELIAEFGL